MDLTDKRVVVIGGSSGIGYAVAEGALAQGAEVVIGSSQAANVEAAAAKLGNRAAGHAVNVREEPSTSRPFSPRSARSTT